MGAKQKIIMKHNFTFLVLIFNFSKIVLQKKVGFFGENTEEAFRLARSHSKGAFNALEELELKVTGVLDVPLNSSDFFNEKLRDMKMSVANTFDKLLRLKSLYNEDLFQFLTPEQVAKWRNHIEDMPQVSWYNDITGNTMNLAISSISKEGIFGYLTDPDFENDAYRQIKFSDVVSIDDQITLVNEMENNVQKHL